MGKKVEIKFQIENKLNNLLEKYSKNYNSDKNTIIANTLKEKFQKNENQTNYVMLREQLYMELLILENREIMIDSKILKMSNYNELVRDLENEKIGVKKRLKVVDEIINDKGMLSDSGILLQ